MSENIGAEASRPGYEEIMGDGNDDCDAAAALSSRLVSFRRWLLDEAGCIIHPSVCIVNGEATDGTRNAPVLLFGPSPSSEVSASGGVVAGGGRCGVIDKEADRAMYDRTIGCQVRVVKELKKDEAMMKIPRSSMVTPDLIAFSDAGRAVLACCERIDGADGPNLWDFFQNTASEEQRFMDKFSNNSGAQILVKILQERKKAERALAEAERAMDSEASYKLANRGTISTRAPMLAFLLHQRFSNELNPAVSSGNNSGCGQMENLQSSNKEKDLGENSAEQISRTSPSVQSPLTFGPYARILPSSISLPICWQRNELALLAGCIPGTLLLQEIAARTMQLSSDLIAMVRGGILHRFPQFFPRGSITWDRWMWAASCFTSRALPATCYLNKGENTASEHQCYGKEQFYSPPEVWDELGVMVPLLDMLNHDFDAAQVTWEPPTFPENTISEDEDKFNGEDTQIHAAQAVMHKKAKKGSQIYTNYGNLSNHNLILQYGFAQINNPADELRIGWGLMDAVGGIQPSSDYPPPDDADLMEDESRYIVYESDDPVFINNWWTRSRLSLLETETMVDEKFVSSLKAGRKMTANAYSQSIYDPAFLTASVVATMAPQAVAIYASSNQSELYDPTKKGIIISKRHQRILRQYIIFFFTRKLEKLLQSLNNGLKDHFNVHLCNKKPDSDVGENGSVMGWQHFFDSYAYNASMEVEKKYYAMGSDSCVLTMYDGHLRSIQKSIDGAKGQKEFEESALAQLVDLGFILSEEEEDAPDGDAEMSEPVQLTETKEDKMDHVDEETQKLETPGDEVTPLPEKEKNNDKIDAPLEQQSAPNEEQDHFDAKAAALDRGRNYRRNRKKGDRPPAIKLHIGNLSYQTTPSSLYDYFAGIYGKDHVLECHIPTERETGRSRGFGFVTMPKETAKKALESDKPHQVDGRILKVAESNTAGSGSKNQPPCPGGIVSSDRCSSCGYRPKYCTCMVPILPSQNFPSYAYTGGGMMGVPYPPDDMYGPTHGTVTDYNDYGGPHRRHPTEYERGKSWNNRGRSHSRSTSPWRSGGRGDYRREGRQHDRGHRDHHNRSCSRSRSYSRGRDRDRDNRKDRDRGRGGEKEREDRTRGKRESSGRGSSSAWAARSSRSSRFSRSKSHSRSRSYEKGASSRQRGDRERKTNGVGNALVESQRGRSRSHSLPPSQSRVNNAENGSEKKREGKSRNRSRSRSRGRSGRRKRSSKERHRKESSKRNSRSRSWSKD